jgi:hypothetical protein
MKKKLFQCKLSFLLMAALILVNAAVPVMAASTPEKSGDVIKICLNGTYLSGDVAPVIENSRTLVPVRIVSEEIGARVNWDNEKQMVTVKADGNEIRLNIGSEEATIINSTGEKTESMGVAPFIKNERTMVPLRFIAEKLGLEVSWDDTERTIGLTSKNVNQEVAGKAQIEDYMVAVNSSKEADISFYTNKVVKPQVKVLSKNDPVFKGEDKVKDDSLGEYRLEILLYDTDVSKALRDKLGLETVKINGDNLLQSIRLAYPPDDSAMAIYLGCKAFPRVDLLVNDNGFFLDLVNENIQDGLKVNCKNIISENEFSQVKFSIPQIDGLKTKAIQDSINDKFVKRASGFEEETFAGLDEYVKEAKKEGWPIRPYAALTNYRVTYSNNDILSLYVDYYSYTGGAHGFTDRVHSNIDLKTGKELQLNNLFKSGVDYKDILSKEIKRQMRLEPDKYFPETLKDWQGISNDQPYYIEDGNLVIYFPLYEIAPYAGGIPEFIIPLTGDLQGALKIDL